MESEKRLLEALRNRDLEILDELLHDNLLFIIPNGQIITKPMDMEAYRSGNMNINAISSGEQVINLIDDTAVASAVIEIKGKYLDQLIDGKFRYMRVWKLFSGKWKVVAGSSIQL